LSLKINGDFIRLRMQQNVNKCQYNTFAKEYPAIILVTGVCIGNATGSIDTA